MKISILWLTSVFLLFLIGCAPNSRSLITLPFSKTKFASVSGDVKLWAYRYKISGMSPSGIALIDAYHRGLHDIVVTSPASSSISFFRNQGDGTFKETQLFKGCPGGDNIDAEDLTGDGFEDFLVSCPANNMMSLFMGDGKGNFKRHDINVSQGLIAAQAAPHVDQPGTPFLSILHNRPAKLELLMNRGNGNFEYAKDLPVPADPSGFASDRFTKDGSISYAVSSSAESKFSVYLNHNGQFDRKDYLAPEAASGIVTLDMRALGIMDLAVTSGTLNLFRIYFNDGDGNFTTSKEYSVPGGSISKLGTSHLRGTKQAELITQVDVTGDIVIYPNLGNGTLGSPEVIQVGSQLTGLVTGHLIHKSDDMDIALIDAQTTELVVLLNERNEF